jgi:cell division septation protein DedD
MPRLNLKDEGLEMENEPAGAKPTNPAPMLREIGGGSGKLSPIILILLILVVLAGGIYALNHFKVIRLWGKKAPVVTETLPEPDLSTAPPAAAGAAPVESAPAPGATTAPSVTPATSEPAVPSKAKPAATTAPSGSGKYTIQFSAWMSKAKAEEQTSLLNGAGYEAFVDDSHAGGDHWYRVRVGRFDTRAQAQEVIQKLQPMTEDVVWVATLRQK